MFKEGDKVQLIEGLAVGSRYGDYTLLDCMVFEGTATVRSKTDYDCLLSNGFYYDNSMLKLADDENKLQRKESSVSGGDKRKGRVVCSRRNKATIAVGHLSNKACY